MGESLAGTLLVATPSLLDPNFDKTVVFVLQHDTEGALGLILNRPTDSPVDDHLPACSPLASDPAVVFVGGPVEPEVAIGLERSDTPQQPTDLPGIGFLDVQDPMPTALCRVYSGYSGWGSGQLEAEIGEGSWIVVAALASDVFTTDPEQLWAMVLRRQGGRLSMLSTYPEDPSVN